MTMTTRVANACLTDPELPSETLGSVLNSGEKITDALTQPVDKAESFPAGKVLDRDEH